MPHIHTEPGQHDITVSAYIIRIDQAEPKLLVHMHKKVGKLMQIGGHIELNETPWQALSHEVLEESGYALTDLKVLQPQASPFVVKDAVVHPVPLLLNTHKVSSDHYHTDLVYGFVTDHAPSTLPGEGESTDLRWLSASELNQETANGNALKDVGDIFAAILDNFTTYSAVDTAKFSLSHP